MDDRRLISLSDDDDMLGGFAEEGEAADAAASVTESRHFFGPSSPDAELPAVSADDWPLAPRVAFPAAAPPVRPAVPVARRISLPEAEDDGAPKGLWRYAPGWKTVAVLAVLLLIQGARILIPMLQQATSRPPTFTLAEAVNSSTPPTSGSKTSTPPALTGPVPAPLDSAPAAALEPRRANVPDRARDTGSAPAAATSVAREPAVAPREAALPTTAAVASSRGPAPAPARVEPRATEPPRATVTPAAVTEPVRTPAPRPNVALPAPPSAADAPVAPPAFTSQPAAPPVAAVVPTPRITPPPAAASSGGAPTTAAPPVASPAAPPANASSVPAAGTGLGEENAVRLVLERYRSAYSTLNADDAKAVWPNVDAKTLSKAFDQLQSQELQFVSCQVAINGDRANATCGGQAAWVPKVGSRNSRSTFREWNFNLQRSGDRWLIAGVNMR